MVYTIYTHRAIPTLEAWWIDHARTIALTVTMLIAGLVRRGPRLSYQQLVLMTGFGVNAEPALESSGDRDRPASQSNVLDWSNCSLLSFIGLFYVSWPHELY